MGLFSCLRSHKELVHFFSTLILTFLFIFRSSNLCIPLTVIISIRIYTFHFSRNINNLILSNFNVFVFRLFFWLMNIPFFSFSSLSKWIIFVVSILNIFNISCMISNWHELFGDPVIIQSGDIMIIPRSEFIQ